MTTPTPRRKNQVQDRILHKKPVIINPVREPRKVDEYGSFWLSPDGELFPTELGFGHESVREQISHHRHIPLEKIDESHGWVRIRGTVKGPDVSWPSSGPSQRQSDILMDMVAAYLMNGKKSAAMYLNRQLRRKYGSVSSPDVVVDLKKFQQAVHWQLMDYMEDSLRRRERARSTLFDLPAAIHRLEPFVGQTPEVRKGLRGGELTERELTKLVKDALDTQSKMLKDPNADFDATQVIFDVIRELMDYRDAVTETDDDVRASYERSERNIVDGTQALGEEVARQLRDAVKRVEIPLPGRIYVRPMFDEREPPTDPVHAYSVEIGKGHLPPSFTVFVDARGKIDQVEDQLEGGDTDFFHDAPTQGFYFDLIKELEHPGSTARPGRLLTLYTARPTKDRKRYERGRDVPVNVFLTTDPDRAAGIAHDLGSREVRDVWMVKIQERYVVPTLQTGRLKDYQTVGAGKTVPVKDMALVMEGEPVKRHGAVDKVDPWFWNPDYDNAPAKIEKILDEKSAAQTLWYDLIDDILPALRKKDARMVGAYINFGAWASWSQDQVTAVVLTLIQGFRLDDKKLLAFLKNLIEKFPIEGRENAGIKIAIDRIVDYYSKHQNAKNIPEMLQLITTYIKETGFNPPEVPDIEKRLLKIKEAPQYLAKVMLKVEYKADVIGKVHRNTQALKLFKEHGWELEQYRTYFPDEAFEFRSGSNFRAVFKRGNQKLLFGEYRNLQGQLSHTSMYHMWINMGNSMAVPDEAALGDVLQLVDEAVKTQTPRHYGNAMISPTWNNGMIGTVGPDKGVTESYLFNTDRTVASFLQTFRDQGLKVLSVENVLR
jgi:hypothetical protein